MPVLASTGSNSDISHLSGHLDGDRSLASRFSILLGAATAIVAASLLFQRFASLWLSRRHQQRRFRGGPRMGVSTCKPPPNFQKLPDRCCMRPGKGPGHFEKQASWAISRGEASGTASVGLGGSVEGSSPGSMEEEESTTLCSTDRSRGVSTFLSPGTTQASSGLSFPGHPFPAAAAGGDDGGHDVRISTVSHPPPPLGREGGACGGSASEKGKINMDDVDCCGTQPGSGSVVATSRTTTPFFGQPEDITYGGSGSVPVNGGLPSWRRRFEPASIIPPLPPTLADQNPVYPAQRTSFETRRLPTTYAQSVPADLDIVRAGFTRLVDGQGHGPEYTAAVTPPSSGTSGSTSICSPTTNISRSSSYAKGHPIPPRTVPDTQMPQEVDGGVIGASRGALTPSSYPPTSPLLPPPPPTMDYHFDLANIMFPGAGAVDGGVRVVPAEDVNEHCEGGSVGAHGEAAGIFDDSVTSWKRHTRVYGGGVCLACAAAGGGGFYGTRVRPEDKR